MEKGGGMKAVITVKIKAGYLVFERDIESLATEEVCSGSVIEDDGYGYRDKVGRIAAEILNPPKKAPPPPAPLAGVAAAEEAPGD
jgi:hypothetical protein